ncbi:hypothetical protein J2754_002516 [Halarchaeum solikamskense]|nr:hypothetical protein [Halarchaeum solikamskense]
MEYPALLSAVDCGGAVGFIPALKGGAFSLSLRKLPRPTRSLPPCGGRSLLEDGALPKRHCAPRPHAWTRPGFLLPSLPRRGCIVDASHSDRGRDCPADLIPGVLTLYPHTGNGSSTRSRSSFPSTGYGTPAPQEPVYWWLLSSPTCARSTVEQDTSRTVLKNVRTRFLSALPASSTLVEDGGSALPRAEHTPLPFSRPIAHARV